MRKIRDLIECMRVGRLLQSYLDGELDDAHGAAMVARHLQACRRCGMAADSIQTLKNHVAGLRHDPDPEQVERIEQVIDELTERTAGPERGGRRSHE